MITEAMVEAAVTAQKKWYQDAFEFNDGPDTDVSERAAMRAALETAERAAWQPIETMAQDERILVWNGKKIHLVMNPNVNGVWLTGNECTHWHPLPAPPGATP